MTLSTTPPSILTLVTWVPPSKLAFGHSARRLTVGPPALGQTESYSVQPCLPLTATIGPIKSLFLWSPARILDSRAQLYSS